MAGAARLLGSPGVHQQRVHPGAAQHQRGRQAGGAAADDQGLVVGAHRHRSRPPLSPRTIVSVLASIEPM